MVRTGMMLIWTLLVMVVIAIILSSFFLTTMNENVLVIRYIASVRAFWAAETGISEARADLPNTTFGTVGGGNYGYNTTTTLVAAEHYRLDSTGTVTLPTGGTVTRSLSAVLKTDPVASSNFQHAVRTTVELDVQGAVTINGPTEEYATLNFPDLFGISKADLEACADHVYTDPPNNITPVDEITWINVPAGDQIVFSSSGWSGSGLLVINGDALITGGTFDGILYVIGELTVGAGNPTISGTILVESDVALGETGMAGVVTVNYDADKINDSLVYLSFAYPEVVSWREQ